MTVRLNLRNDRFLQEWWYNISETLYETCQFGSDGPLFRRTMESLMNEFGARLCENFWTIDENEYIEFNSEEELTAFVLRWS